MCGNQKRERTLWLRKSADKEGFCTGHLFLQIEFQCPVHLRGLTSTGHATETHQMKLFHDLSLVNTKFILGQTRFLGSFSLQELCRRDKMTYCMPVKKKRFAWDNRSVNKSHTVVVIKIPGAHGGAR